MMAQRLVGDGLSRMNLDRTSVRARWQRPELASISPGLQFSYVPSPSGGEPPTPSRHPSITNWVAIAGWRLMPTGKMPSLGRVGEHELLAGAFVFRLSTGGDRSFSIHSAP